jgi:hypothetical protein
MFLLWLGAAAAADLDFNPDRPGIGDSTTTVGAGHVLIEAGARLELGDPTIVQSDAIMGRFGVDDGVEVRLRLPDVKIRDGAVTLGAIGLGAKFGGAVGDRWAVSFIPEIAFDAESEAPIGLVSSQVSGDFGAVGAWLHIGATLADGGSTAVVGGGVAVPVRDSGLYVHAAHTLGADPFVGLGGWLRVAEAAQLDGRIDLIATPGAVVPVVLAGGSVGF